MSFKKYVSFFLLLFISTPLIVFAQNVSKDDWINSLSQCESQGRPNITILDSNDKYSFGEYQFQFSTFSVYAKMYKILPEDMSDGDILLLIHNSYIQRALARDMLDDGLSYNWKICTKKIGPYPVEGS